MPVCKDLSRVGLADSPQMDGFHGVYAGLAKMKQVKEEMKIGAGQVFFFQVLEEKFLRR